MNNDLNTKEKTSSVDNSPPPRYSLPLPDNLDRCVGCPYPGVGFICWCQDGSCLKTYAEESSRRSDGR
jgi:hypothetical protein